MVGTKSQAEWIALEGPAPAVVRPKFKQDRRDYIMPVVGGRLSRRGFGARRHPFTGRKRMHYGQDITGPYGSPVLASRGGEIVGPLVRHCASWSRSRRQRRCGGGFGNYVVIRDSAGNYSVYAHLQGSNQCRSLAKLRVGQKVQQGQPIGCLGSSGSSTGPHLHFEIRRGGRHKKYAVDPKRFLLGRR